MATVTTDFDITGVMPASGGTLNNYIFTGVIKGDDGSSGAPSYSFTSAPSAGFFAESSGAQLSWSLAGIGRSMYLNAAGLNLSAAILAQHLVVGAPVTETGATHTLAAMTSYLIANRAGTVTVTLPAAASFTGRAITIKTIQAQLVVSASANVVPLIGGAAAVDILAATDGKWATLVSDGTSWEIMAAN